MARVLVALALSDLGRDALKFVMALALAVRHWRDRGKRSWGVYDEFDGGQDGYLVPARYIDTDTGVAPSPQLVGKKIRRLYY